MGEPSSCLGLSNELCFFRIEPVGPGAEILRTRFEAGFGDDVDDSLGDEVGLAGVGRRLRSTCAGMVFDLRRSLEALPSRELITSQLYYLSKNIYRNSVWFRELPLVRRYV